MSLRVLEDLGIHKAQMSPSVQKDSQFPRREFTRVAGAKKYTLITEEVDDSLDDCERSEAINRPHVTATRADLPNKQIQIRGELTSLKKTAPQKPRKLPTTRGRNRP